MPGPPIVVRHPGASGALVLSVPHGGTDFPHRFRTGLTVAPEDLWSDWYTTELFDFGPELPVSAVVAGSSRFVANPNRAPQPPLTGSFWSSAVPTSDPWGSPLYRAPLTAAQIDDRLDVAHHPYHRAIDQLVEARLRRHDRVLLLDLHSFGIPLPADIVIGDRNGTSALPTTSRRVADAFTHAGFAVARNLRFTGGYIIDRWRDHARVDALQIEVNQRTYLSRTSVDGAIPRPPRTDAPWRAVHTQVRAVLASLAS